MFAHLKMFSVTTGCKAIKGNIKKDGLTDAQRDQAVAEGVEYFRKNKTNFAVDERDLRSAVRGLTAIAAMKGNIIPAAQAAQSLHVLAPWVEMQILSAEASTYASLWKQGQTNKYWSADNQLAAKEACEFFKI